MAGLPRKYAKMGFKKGWAAYRSKKRKAPKTSRKRTAKKAKPMVRRRGRARRAVRRAIHARSKTVPLVDAIHGIYTLDGITNGAASKTIKATAGVITGQGTSTKAIESNIMSGVNYVADYPKDAVIGGIKNFATGHLIRKAAGLFLPRSVKLFGKWRIQVR
jgi:hypothetical protein